MSDVTRDQLDRTKLSDAEIAYLKGFLDAGDRAGFYMAYYNIVSAGGYALRNSEVGKNEASLQTIVATFSGQVGAVAYLSNRLFSEALPANKYENIYLYSQGVAQASLKFRGHDTN